MRWPTIDEVLRAAEIATLLALGMAIGAAIDSELSMENWLYRWSTLLTGMLAVGAAFITVRAMMHADAKQQMRHDALMNHATRSDRLAVTGLHKMAISNSEAAVAIINNVTTVIRDKSTSITECVRRFTSCYETIIDANLIGFFVAARHLFDSDANETSYAWTLQMLNINETVKLTNTTLKNGFGEEAAAEARLDMISLLEGLKPILERIVDDSKRLEERYC